MVSSLQLLLSIAALSFLQPSGVDAHTQMIEPKPTFPKDFEGTKLPYGRVDTYHFTGKAKDIVPWKGVERAAAAMADANAKTLRAFIMSTVNISNPAATKECGMSLATGDKQQLPDIVNFPWGHPGPCEIWCDNTRLFFNEDCQGNKVGKVPVDKTKCQGASFIQGMYLGVHIQLWETYGNCVPLIGGKETDVTKALAASASGTGANDNANDATSAPTFPTPTPTKTPTPTPMRSVPTTTKTPTPSSSSKCNVRRRG